MTVVRRAAEAFRLHNRPLDPLSRIVLNVVLVGLVVAASSQVAADLLGGPGRAPEEGRVLLDWMEANEPAWRQ